MVPYRLKQAPRCEMALGDAQIAKAVEQLRVDRIAECDCEELGRRQLCWVHLKVISAQRRGLSSATAAYTSLMAIDKLVGRNAKRATRARLI